MSPFTLDDAVSDLEAAYRSNEAVRMAEAEAQVDTVDPALHPDQGPPSLLGAALWYAEQHIPVLPLHPGLKAPLTRHGLKDATTDAAQIRAWWEQVPQANIGLRTGIAFDVIDIDGPAGQKSRCDQWQAFAEMDVLGTVCTPRPGGMHLYRPAAGHGNRANLLPSIDYRGFGGYVVAPPSRTDRGAYRWITPLDLSCFKALAAAGVAS